MCHTLPYQMKYYFLLLIIILVISCLPNSKPIGQGVLDSPEILYLNHFNADDTIFWVGNDGMNYGELDKGFYYYLAKRVITFPNLNNINTYEAEVKDIKKKEKYINQLILRIENTINP